MGKTSSAAKAKWMKENYTSYRVNLRKDTDGELIELVEKLKESGEQTTEIFRRALQVLKVKE